MVHFAAKFKEDDNKDVLITELLFLVGEIRNIVLVQKNGMPLFTLISRIIDSIALVPEKINFHLPAIQTYYLEYLSGYYKTKLQQLVEQTSQTQRFDDRMRAHFDSLAETLSLLSPSQPNVDLEVALFFISFFPSPSVSLLTPVFSIGSEIELD